MKKGQGWAGAGAGAGAAQWCDGDARRRRRSAALLQPHAGRPAQSGRGHPTKRYSDAFSSSLVAHSRGSGQERPSELTSARKQAGIHMHVPRELERRKGRPQGQQAAGKAPASRSPGERGRAERSPPRRRVRSAPEDPLDGGTWTTRRGLSNPGHHDRSK